MQNIDGQNRQIKMPAIFCRAVFNISADFSAIIFIIIFFLSPILRKIILILISLRDFLNYKFNFENFSLRRFELKNKGKVILNCFGLL